MTSISGLVAPLSAYDQIHLPSLRFALRSVVATGTHGDHFIEDDDRLFRLVGPALIWQEPTIGALWAKLDRFVEPHHRIELRDAPSLRKLLLTGDRTLWSAYQSEVLGLWVREPEAISRAFAETLTALEETTLRHRGQHANLAHVASLYCLDALEIEILECAVTAQQWPDFRQFLRHMPLASMGAAWGVFAGMVGCSEHELRKVLEPDGRLRSCSLIKVDGAPDHMGEFVEVGLVSCRLFLTHAESPDGLRAKFLEPVEPPLLTAADFPHLAEEFKWIVRCLQTAVRARELGVNVLLQGRPGTGKTQFARLLVQATGLCGFQVSAVTSQVEPSIDMEERLEQFAWTQRILQTHPGAVMVCEGVGHAANYAERRLKERLDCGPIPTIWISDGSDEMSDSVLRRFVFCLRFRQPPISARRRIVLRAMVDFSLDPDKLEALAQEPGMSPARLAMAARFARLGSEDDPASRTKALLCAIDAGQRIKGRPALALRQPAISPDWDMEALNLETSAPLPRILDALRRAKGASLAFHGIPGTGKTSLAAHIANTLERPLLTRRVSDLSSKWLGETEKALANMFREAAAENAVLLLDEADSFLRDRRLARHSWEVTQVNELLQQIETFKGVFICATNLFEDIDAAALRRFTFKIRFLPLDEQGRQRMLARFALSEPNAALPGAICDRLAALSQLAPGDFATVRRQEVLIDERFSLEAWITELEREHGARVPLARQRAAFV